MTRIQGLGVAISAGIGLGIYFRGKPRTAGIVTIVLVLIWGFVSKLLGLG